MKYKVIGGLLLLALAVIFYVVFSGGSTEQVTEPSAEQIVVE